MMWLLSYYIMVIFMTALVYSLALLFGLVGSTSPLGKQQALSAIGFAGLALLVFAPTFMIWCTQTVWWTLNQGSPLFDDFGRSRSPMEWVYLPIAGNVWVAHLFQLGNVVLMGLIVWQILLRKFRIPQATLLSKYISYVGVAYLNVLVWGFFQSSAIEDYARDGGAIALLFLNIVLLVGLIFALAPTRQTLIDWMRYRRHGLMDWVWNDNSPSLVAIAINALIALALLIPWLLLATDLTDATVPLILSMVSLATVALIYATIVQIIFSMRLRSPLVWAAGIVAIVAFVPPVALAILTSGMSERSSVMIALWTFLGFPFWDNYEANIATSGLLIGWILQLVLLSVLFFRLKGNLKKLSPKVRDRVV